MTAKYTYELLQEAVNNSESYAGVLRYLKLRQAGGTHSHLKKQICKFGINTSHFTGKAHNKGKPSPKRRSFQEVLVTKPEGSNREHASRLRRAMLDFGLTYSCRCGIVSEWQGKPIILEIDHINGNPIDNRITNLRFLCPNCHSQEILTNKSWKHMPA